MNWEPWTGCYKASDGCTNCYFYGPHAKRYGQSTIEKTDKFDWPVRKSQTAGITSREIKSSPLVLRPTFSCPKRMSGAERLGR